MKLHSTLLWVVVCGSLLFASTVVFAGQVLSPWTLGAIQPTKNEIKLSTEFSQFRGPWRLINKSGKYHAFIHQDTASGQEFALKGRVLLGNSLDFRTPIVSLGNALNLGNTSQGAVEFEFRFGTPGKKAPYSGKRTPAGQR
jgi:hypothetical protein